jgi:cell division protein FtsQ
MARKPGPSILQEELYPPHAANAREESVSSHTVNSHVVNSRIDDARLVDLDVDEESPFLRAQKRVSARRSSLPKKTASRLLWGVGAAALVGLLGLGAAGLYHYGEHSWRFRVESSDNIEVTGTHNVTKAQIMEVMGADIGRNIFFIPLAQQKAQLEQIPWVESASVMRFVPNRLAVQIHERTPIAFARVGPHMFLIDAGGTLMDLTPKHKFSFPVILGMNPGEPLSTRAPRMQAYLDLVQQLDSGGGHYSQDLSEVDISDLDDVKVRVNDPAGDVLVHLGSSDYLQRYKIYVSHAQAWRQQFQKLESVDLRYDNQIIVNPDMQRSAKAATLTPASDRAAGKVKPAAMLSRIGPNERGVPKPAFELSQKTLQPKAKAAKLTPKRKKAAAKTRTIASAKKPVLLAKPNTAQSKPPSTSTASPKIVSPAPQSQRQTGGQKPSPGIVRGQEGTQSTN